MQVHLQNPLDHTLRKQAAWAKPVAGFTQYHRNAHFPVDSDGPAVSLESIQCQSPSYSPTHPQYRSTPQVNAACKSIWNFQASILLTNSGTGAGTGIPTMSTTPLDLSSKRYPGNAWVAQPWSIFEWHRTPDLSFKEFCSKRAMASAFLSQEENRQDSQ